MSQNVGSFEDPYSQISMEWTSTSKKYWVTVKTFLGSILSNAKPAFKKFHIFLQYVLLAQYIGIRVNEFCRFLKAVSVQTWLCVFFSPSMLSLLCLLPLKASNARGNSLNKEAFKFKGTIDRDVMEFEGSALF